VSPWIQSSSKKVDLRCFIDSFLILTGPIWIAIIPS
jgi:hypothetical protein